MSRKTLIIARTNNIIQQESAKILMFLGFFSTGIAVIPILLMGTITDRFGRKIPLIISIIGVLLKEIVMIVTIYKDLSLWVFVVGEFCQGIIRRFDFIWCFQPCIPVMRLVPCRV